MSIDKPVAKVLRPTKSLLGKPRMAGDLIYESELAKMTSTSINALVRGQKLEVFASNDKGFEAITERLEILEAKVEDMLKNTLESGAEKAPDPPKKPRGRPRKLKD